ncbi:MAG: hypothetical protein KBD50_03480 [Candidatus Pacebacteria bacterium]|nr:hypothetical protein [Candidatus Paceibacterota bacterium]
MTLPAISSNTLLLPIYNGLRARNFFLTDLYPELLSQGMRLVILVPPHKIEYYRAVHAHPQVIFEEWNPAAEHWFGRLLNSFAFNALGTGTVKQKQYAVYVRDKKFVKFLLRRYIAVLCGGVVWIRKLIRALDRLVPADHGLAAMLKKYNPSAVLAPDIILPTDRVLLRTAKRLGYKTIGMVRSWDNLTAKGVIQVMPDWLIAQTTQMKKEAILLGDMKPENIIVCGVAQFDEYFKPATHTREQFLDSLKIPHDRRLVLCAPFFGEYSQKSGLMLVEALAKAIDDGRLPQNTHLLVRYRPEDGTAEGAPTRFSHSHITATLPYSKSFTTPRGKKDYEFAREDVELMVNSLRYSDVTLNTISTLTVDAVALDKPVVNIRFDIDPNTPPGSRVELYAHFDHYKALEATGGITLTNSFNELVEAINVYLANPAKHAEGRAKIRREQIEFEDAGSGKRSAEAIAKLLN